MKVKDQEHLRARIYSFLGTHSKSEVVRHFLSENYKRSTIYQIIKRYENDIPAQSAKKTGRPPILNKKKLEKLGKMANEAIGTSQRKLSRKFSVSKTCIQENLSKLGLKYYKRKTVPQYTEKQLEIIPKRCRILRRKYLCNNAVIIMDDEKYFTFANNSLTGNDGFYTKNVKLTSPGVKFTTKSKFEPKVLVWLAISAKGVSRPYVGTTRSSSINSEVYRTKCLPKLVPFIEKHHKNDKIIFWPDLASSHYARDTIKWLEDKKIPFVPKTANPPNVPKARPIEDFWALLSRIVYDKGWEAKNQQELRKKIFKSIKKVDLNVVQKMMAGVKAKLRKMEEGGPLAIQ